MDTRNDSIDYYREIMDATRVDIQVAFPQGFDQMLANHPESFPRYVHIGIEPPRLSLVAGELYSVHPGEYV